MTSTHSSTVRYQVLDGWRAVSILCVLAAHLLPLGLKSWQLNAMFGIVGMSLFFTLSGFLITTNLLRGTRVRDFLIRRFCRILPLAWLFLLVVLPLTVANFNTYLAHFFFYANLPPFWLVEMTGHFWSLCLEMQFYVFVALLILLLKKPGLFVLPWLCIMVTIGRVWYGEPVSIVTYFRVDEILAGASLALILQSSGKFFLQFFAKLNSYLLILGLLIASHSAMPLANYLRPYLATMLVGSTLVQEKTKLSCFLSKPSLAYIAIISYALYVVHPLTTYGWLGSGDGVVKYTKRIISFILTFGLAHISTFYYEKRWIAWGKKWTS